MLARHLHAQDGFLLSASEPLPPLCTMPIFLDTLLRSYAGSQHLPLFWIEHPSTLLIWLPNAAAHAPVVD
ncbi:uncharacterized [Tachysurus ichikawai]